MFKLRQEDAKTSYFGAMDKEGAVRGNKSITRDQRDSGKQFSGTVVTPTGSTPPGPRY